MSAVLKLLLSAQKKLQHLVQDFGQGCKKLAAVKITACTFEGKFDSFACTCACLFPIKARCRNLELSLALHSNEAAAYKAIN